MSGGSGLQRVIEHLHPVPHGRVGAALQMGDAADIGADDGLGFDLPQVAEFAVAQLVCKIRVEHAVGARGAAAQVRLAAGSANVETQFAKVLFHAAPELLALLIELIDIEGPQPGTATWANKVEAAIAKATGQ